MDATSSCMRNAENWCDRGAGEQRYNCLYFQEELFPYAEFLKERKEAPGTTTFVFMNNHFGGKAATNALQLMLMLSEPVNAEIPATMKEAFPILDGDEKS